MYNIMLVRIVLWPGQSCALGLRFWLDLMLQVHERAAKRLLSLCESNRGFYIKAGQFVASMQQVPKQFVSTLSVLQDKVIFLVLL